MNRPAIFAGFARAKTCALALSVAALGIVSVPSAAQFQFVPGQFSNQSVQVDVIPFEVQNGLIVVKALMGDGLVTSAILDTGLPICVMTTDYAAKHGLKSSGTKDIPVLDRNETVLNTPPQAIRINRMLVTSALTGVLDLYSKLSAAPPQDAPPLWIGNSALAALSYTIDPLNEKITLRPPGAPLPPGAIVVPFELKDGRIWVDVKVNGKKNFSALIDTGSVGTMLPAKLVKDLALTPSATFPVTHPDGGAGKVCAVELADIAMAGLKVTDVQAIYVDQKSKDGFDPDLGIIGNDVLLRYRVTIDCMQKKIAFEKYAAPKQDTIATGGPSRPQNGQLPAGARPSGQGNTKITPLPGRPGGQ